MKRIILKNNRELILRGTKMLIKSGLDLIKKAKTKGLAELTLLIFSKNNIYSIKH